MDADTSVVKKKHERNSMAGQVKKSEWKNTELWKAMDTNMGESPEPV